MNGEVARVAAGFMLDDVDPWIQGEFIHGLTILPWGFRSGQWCEIGGGDGQVGGVADGGDWIKAVVGDVGTE